MNRMQSTEDRLADTFEAVARQTIATNRWEQLVDDIEIPVHRVGGGRRPWPSAADRSGSRPFLLAAAALVAMLCLGAFMLVASVPEANITSVGSTVDYVLPGEVVISENPLIVQGRVGPTPAFDTTILGREIVVEPITEIDDEINTLVTGTLQLREDGPPRAITKVTLVGRLGEETVLTAVLDGPNIDGLDGRPLTANLRTRHLISPDGGSVSRHFVPTASMEVIEPPNPDDPWGAGFSFDPPRGHLVLDRLPETVSVVSLADSDTRLWVRPVDGIALFPVEFHTGEEFILRAFDRDGRVMWSKTHLIEGN